MVSDFENNLKKNYPKLSIAKACEQYLIEIISNSTTEFETFKYQTQNIKPELTKSGLWNEIYLKDDNNGLLINETGQYTRGLNYVAKSDKLIKNIMKKRQAAGMMSNEYIITLILILNF